MATQFGRYQLIRELGRGGMATVYLGRDPRFERDVAVKVLPAQFMHDPQFIARFQREAQTIAKLEHPAIVPVYDFGDENGQPYIVMRYMSGGSLSERIQQGETPLDQTLAIVQRIASALEAAHKHGIVHRDLKPGNILFDQYDNAYLADFGIVKLAESNATFTGTGIVGSPAYMSPEQAQGGRKIDQRTDIYSLGIIVFEMLTGKAPFEGETPVQQLMKHIMEQPPVVSRVKPNLPAAIDPVVTRALAKDPDDRFASVEEFSSALASATTVAAANGTPQPTITPAQEAGLATIVESPTGETASGTGELASVAPSMQSIAADPIPTGAQTGVGSDNKRSIPGWLVGALILVGIGMCAIAGIVGANALGFGDAETATATQPAVVDLVETPTKSESSTQPATAAIEPTEERALPTKTNPPSATDTPPPTITPMPTAAPLSGRVVLWHSWAEQEREALDRIIDAFKAQNPEVEFESVFIPFTQLRQQFENAAAAGNAPTMIFGTLEWGAALLDAGVIQDMAPFLDREAANHIHPTLLAGARSGENLVGAPYAGKGVVLYRNKALIPEAPTSFADILALDPALYDLERGFFYSGGSLLGLGGQLMDDEGNPAFNNALGVSWLNQIKRHNDGQNYGNDDIIAFEREEVGLIVDGTWNAGRLARAIGPNNLSIDLWFPGMRGFIFSDLAMLASDVPAGDIPANMAFAVHMLSEPAQRNLLQLSRMPATLGVGDANPLVEQMSAAVESGVLFPMRPEMDYYWEPLTIAIEFVVADGGDPQAALNAAETTIDQALNSR